MDERQRISQRIIDLEVELDSSASRIGDWAIIKCLECEKLGKEIPYDLDDIMAKRQAVRDEINALQDQLKALEEQEEE